jgi:hypothetical protein
VIYERTNILPRGKNSKVEMARQSQQRANHRRINAKFLKRTIGAA